MQRAFARTERDVDRRRGVWVARSIKKQSGRGGAGATGVGEENRRAERPTWMSRAGVGQDQRLGRPSAGPSRERRGTAIASGRLGGVTGAGERSTSHKMKLWIRMGVKKEMGERDGMKQPEDGRPTYRILFVVFLRGPASVRQRAGRAAGSAVYGQANRYAGPAAPRPSMCVALPCGAQTGAAPLQSHCGLVIEPS